jgi:hypothetical protein
MITVVTAFVPIPGHPRSAAEYDALAKPLLTLQSQFPVLCARGGLDRCWLYHYLYNNYYGPDFTHSIADNPKKNSLAYHIVQAQKTEWLVMAASLRPLSDVFVWIDYGIFHLPGVTQQIIEEFLQRADGERAISVPGCWGMDYDYDDNRPCWRFCGGVMVVPREYVIALDIEMKDEYARWLWEHSNISWEVNTLARLERNSDLPIWWYKADHDASMFTAYQVTENADDSRKL